MSNPQPDRLPPGQTLTVKWPVLHVGQVPPFEQQSWSLELVGLVDRPLCLSWSEFNSRPPQDCHGDFHCVTAWSRLNNRWSGVRLADLAAQAGLQSSARFLIVTAEGGYTTNLPLAAALASDVLLATHHDGQPLAPEHGGPLRLVVPALYAWKSAKWVRRLAFVAEDQAGYWEARGYASNGDPWTEDRYA